MLDLTEIQRLHDAAYERNQDTRESAADDQLFFWITQWDDQLLDTSQLQYRGEFNIIMKSYRQIIGDLANLDIIPDFEPIGETSEDDADLMDGLYRSSMASNVAQEAKKVAGAEAIVCGVGAWELRNEYVYRSTGREQRIQRYPIRNGYACVFWDPNAELLDKSDAEYVSVLRRYSRDAAQRLVRELTGDEDAQVATFKSPEQSFVFPWLRDDSYYIGKFYHRKRTYVKRLIFQDVFGEVRELDEDKYEDQADSLTAEGFDLAGEKEVERYVVTCYTVDGFRVLDVTRIPGEHLPIVPLYGEHAVVEGVEHWEGITRRAKDPQRLRNFQLSYLADIVSRSPRQKPIFSQAQIGGYEYMYNETGSESNYPYYLQNTHDTQGNPLPPGPMGIMPEQKVPDSLILAIQESRTAVEDVANPGLPDSISDPDASGKAIYAMQDMINVQSQVYQDHMKFAVRRDGEIFASMAREIYDTEREVSIIGQDGTRSKVMLMQSEYEPESGRLQLLRDVTRMDFAVYVESRPALQSQRRRNMETLKELLPMVPPGSPLFSALLNKFMMLVDGVDFRDIRDYARQQLILSGVAQPETEEEQQMVEEAQQQERPDPAMELAKAEQMKAQADIMAQQIKQLQLQLEQAKLQLKNKEIDLDAEEQESKIYLNTANALRSLSEVSQGEAATKMQVLDRLRG